MPRLRRTPLPLPLRIALCVAAALALPGAARAQVKLPNGTAIPANTLLIGYLNGSADNGGINEGVTNNDVAVEPQVFSPLCDFSGRFIAKGGGANFAIGWYNVDNGRASNNPPRYRPVDLGAGLNTAAANSDIQLLFPFSSALPAENQRDLSAAMIRQSAAFKGGQIGFVLVPNPNGTGNGNATQYHYTEHRFNVRCSACATPGPWYSHLIVRSRKLENTFYLGFEDLDFTDNAQTGTNGNDLDYEDFLFRFTGIACAGAGAACTIPENKGVCQLGVRDCDGKGTLTCRALTQPGQVAERCDGVDNNCDGQVDEGVLCPKGLVCDRGRCTGICGVEFPCPSGLTCDVNGRCVDPPCAGKTCGANLVCKSGACVSACDGIKCPAPSVCSGGTCLDPCAGVTCGARKLCVNGACVPTCDCLPCATGLACAASGQCVDPGCQNMTCGVGEVCQAGTCVAACTGAVCPSGQRCQTGQCVEPSQDGGGGADAATGGDIGGSTVATGCGCRVGATPASGAAQAPLVVAALALTALLLRRRRG